MLHKLWMKRWPFERQAAKGLYTWGILPIYPSTSSPHLSCVHPTNTEIMPLNLPRQHLNMMEDYPGGNRKHLKMDTMVQESPFHDPSAELGLPSSKSSQNITKEIEPSLAQAHVNKLLQKSTSERKPLTKDLVRCRGAHVSCQIFLQLTISPCMKSRKFTSSFNGT